MCLNNSFINPIKKQEFPWMVDSNGNLKPKPIGIMTTEPVVTKLPLLKPSREPKVINYNNGGETEKKTPSWLPDLFKPKLPEEIEKWIKENPPKNNSDSYQKKDDKSNNMWYDRNKNNSSSAEDAAYNAAIMKLHSEAVPSEEKLPEKLFPEKEEWEGKASVDADTEKRMLAKQRENNGRVFWEEVDYNDLPTEEQMDFADGAFGDQPGFLENNKVLRNVRRLTENGESLLTAIPKAFGKSFNADKESEKYGLAGAKVLNIDDYNKEVEIDRKQREAETLAEEEYTAELSPEERAKYYFEKYLTEEQRKDIENGESLMTYVVNLDGDEQEKLLTAMQEAYNKLPEDKQEEYAFFAEGALYGLNRQDKKRIFEKVKSKGILTEDDLVELGLFTEEDKNNTVATSFLSRINGSYKAKQFGTSFEELEFRLNQERIGQAYSVVADNLFKISDASINGPSKNYTSSDGEILYSDNVNVKPTKVSNTSVVDEAAEIPQVLINQKNGAKSENIFEKTINQMGGGYTKHTKIKTSSGLTTIPDFIHIDENGKIYFYEIKSSETAKYTKNQLYGFAEILENGGWIVSNKKQAAFGTAFIKPDAIYKVVQSPNGGAAKYYKFGH